MTIREAGKCVVLPMSATYRIGFNGNDETELDANSLDELTELWGGLCREFETTENDVDYVELVEVHEKPIVYIKDDRRNMVEFSSLRIGEVFVFYDKGKPHYYMRIYPIGELCVIDLTDGRCYGWYEDDVVERVDFTLVIE